MQFKCITETDNLLPNIAKERMKYLIEKINKIEERIKFLEEEKFYLKLGIPRNYDETETINENIDNGLYQLNKIVGEARFLNYSVQYGMSVSLN